MIIHADNAPVITEVAAILVTGKEGNFCRAIYILLYISKINLRVSRCTNVYHIYLFFIVLIFLPQYKTVKFCLKFYLAKVDFGQRSLSGT